MNDRFYLITTDTLPILAAFFLRDVTVDTNVFFVIECQEG